MRAQQTSRPTLHLHRSWLSCLFLLYSGVALAADTESCPVGKSVFLCRMESVLNLLYVVAAILAVILALVIWAAARAYRRKQSDRSIVP